MQLGPLKISQKGLKVSLLTTKYFYLCDTPKFSIVGGIAIAVQCYKQAFYGKVSADFAANEMCSCRKLSLRVP